MTVRQRAKYQDLGSSSSNWNMFIVYVINYIAIKSILCLLKKRYNKLSGIIPGICPVILLVPFWLGVLSPCGLFSSNSRLKIQSRQEIL